MHVGQGRLAFNFGNAQGRIRGKLEQHGIEVQQQALRRNVVGPQGLIVKTGGAFGGQVKHTAVQNDVAPHLLDAFAHDVLEQALKALQYQFGIAAAFDIQVALEYAVNNRAIDPNAIAPSKVGAQD